MTPIKSRLARKAVKATARHSAHGTVSRLRRNPIRSTVLLGFGCAAGFLVGRLRGGPASA